MLKKKSMPFTPQKAYDLAISRMDMKPTELEKKEIVKLLSFSAGEGYAPAQVCLGQLYHAGSMNVPKDLKKAAYWFKLAAGQNNYSATTFLAIMYERGTGVDKDSKKAMELHLPFAIIGVPESQYFVGNYYYFGKGIVKDFKKAEKWYLPAANRNHTLAQTNLGFIYLSGENGITQDYEKAHHWLQLSGKKNAASQAYLASMHFNGNGIPKDEKESFRLAELSANQNCPEGLRMLGFLYTNGFGTKQNLKKGVHYLLLAVKKNAQNSLEFLTQLIIVKKYDILKDDMLPSLHFFIETANVEAIKSIFQHPDILPESKKLGLIAFAIERRQYEIIKILLESKVNPNEVVNNRSLLQFALEQKDLKSIELLIEHKAVPREIELESFTSFVQNNLIALMALEKINLLEVIPSENLALIKNEINSKNLIAFAEKKLRATEMKKLLGTKNQVSLNILQIAVLCEKPKIIEMLLKKDISPNEPNNKWSPAKLDRALKFYHLTKKPAEDKEEEDLPIKLSLIQKEFTAKHQDVDNKIKDLQKSYQKLEFSHLKKLSTNYKDNKFIQQYSKQLSDFKILNDKAKPIQKDIESIKKLLSKLDGMLKKIELDNVAITPKTKNAKQKNKNSKTASAHGKTTPPLESKKSETLSETPVETKLDHGVEDWVEEKPAKPVKVFKQPSIKMVTPLKQPFENIVVSNREPEPIKTIVAKDPEPAKIITVPKPVPASKKQVKTEKPKNTRRGKPPSKNVGRKKREREKDRDMNKRKFTYVPVSSTKLQPLEPIKPKEILQNPARISNRDSFIEDLKLKPIKVNPEYIDNLQPIDTTQPTYVSPLKDISQSSLSTTAALFQACLSLQPSEVVKPRLEPEKVRCESKFFSKTSLLPTPPKNITLEDALSDHGIQTMSFDLYLDVYGYQQQHIFQLMGATNNMMDSGFSKAENNGRFANNPWDKSENFQEYLIRKKKQINKILDLLEKKSIDFMFLQEIDFLNPYHKSKFSTKEHETALMKLKKEFLQALYAKGYNINISTIADSRNQPMATIYSTATFTSSNKPYGILGDSKDCYRGWNTVLQHKASQQFVSLINLHLSYTDSYFDSIIHLMKLNSDRDIVTIAGGDTNQTSKDIKGLISMNPIFGVTNIQMLNDKLSTVDEKGRDKCYDGFFLAAPINGMMGFQLNDCEVFCKNENGVISLKTIPLALQAYRFTKNGESFFESFAGPTQTYVQPKTRSFYF